MKRCIYIYEFDDKSIYIGLTNNYNTRIKRHLTDKNSQIYKKIKYKNNKYKVIQYSDYISEKDAKKLEIELILKYKNDGYNVLNKTSGGELGGCVLYWTKEKCEEISKNYTVLKEFREKESVVYSKILKQKWYSLLEHMQKLDMKPNGYWTKEKCHKEALKYETRTQYYMFSTSYSSAKKNKWLDEICSHMNTKKRKKKNYWTKEKCHEEALKCKTRNEFKKQFSNVYLKASRSGWLDEICSHMRYQIKPKGYWTKDRCVEESKLYKTKMEFKKNSRVAYEKSIKHKWIDEMKFK